MARLSKGGHVKVINRGSPLYGQYGVIVGFQGDNRDSVERIDPALMTEMVEVDPAAEYDWDDVTEIDTSEEPPGNEALRSVIVSFDHSAFQYHELEILEPIPAPKPKDD